MGFGIDHLGGLALGAFAFLTTYFFAGLLFLRFFAVEARGEFFAEVAPRKKAVHGLGAFLRATDFDAAGAMAEAYGGGGFVDFLSAGAAAANEAFFDIAFAKTQLLHAAQERGFFFGADGE